MSIPYSSKKSIRTLTILKILGAFLGVGYSILQVQYFGASREIEIYFAASSLMYLITSLSQSGQLSEIFLPIYHNILKDHGELKADRAFSIVLNRIFLYSIIVICVAWFASPFLVEIMIPGFTISDQQLALSVFRSMSFFLIITFVSSFIHTYLNAKNIYGKAEFAGFITTISATIILLLFYKTLGVWSLVISFMAGKTIGITYYLIILKKEKFSYSFTFKDEVFDHQDFFKSMFSTVTYSSATQFYTVAITSSISFLPEGVYAVFQYTQQLFVKIASIFINPITTVFFTKYSTLFSRNEFLKLRNISKKSLNFGILIGFGLVVLMITSGKEMLVFLWSSEKFSNESLHLAYLLIITYGVLFIPQILFSIYRKTAVVLGNAKAIYGFSTIGMIISGIAAFFLIKEFHTDGLILSLIISKLLFFSVPLIILVFRAPKYLFIPDTTAIIKLLTIAIFTIFFVEYLSSSIDIGIGNSRINNLILFCATGSIAIFTYFLGSYLWKVQIIKDVLNDVFKRNHTNS